ncbi:MAG: CRTAC1 family protein [Saprospiraceae bacterium]|nr:CRTAC1 family protein [Saprospiraceae bacterium]
MFPVLLVCVPPLLYCQQFTQLTSPPLTNTPGDSRSVNIVDVNGDGLDDIFISNGLGGGQNNELYLNLGGLQFEAVQNAPIVLDNSPSDGATFADTDNDGDPDAFVVTWYGEPNFFYRNDGISEFTHLPDAVTGTTGTYSETAAFADYNNDGLVDVYITNSDGDLRNMLYKNTGNNGFEKISATWLNEAKPTRAAVWSDFDNDCDQDLYTTNEGSNWNSFYRNDGGGMFVKIIGDPSVAETIGSMTASWGDVNNDGLQDLFVGNAGYFQEKNNRLFINNGNGGFTAASTGPINTDGGCTYGSAFADYDNDGDLDLFVANGFCTGTIVNFLYRNNGAGIFERDTTALPSFQTPCSFGTAWGDLNNDGFVDLVVSTCKNNNNAPQTNHLVFTNQGNGNNWLKINLEGTSSNRSAIGAQVRVTAIINGQTVTQLREISAQTGYCGQNSLTAHFGLADADSIESMAVNWPSGLEQLWGNIAANQTISLVEGQPSTVQTPNVFIRLKVAPNPFGDSLECILETEKPLTDARLVLQDAQGRVVQERNFGKLASGTHNLLLDVPGLPGGVYVLQLMDKGSGQQAAVKVVK